MTGSAAIVIFCSLVPPAAEVQARVLAASVRRHHPDARVIARLIGAHDDVSIWDELVDPGLAASVPALLRHALTLAETAVFLAPDAFLTAPLEPVAEALDASGVAVFRRVDSLPEDGKRPNHADLRRAGRIDGGAVALRRGPLADELL
ncbi:MAG TPA: hypothetical protein VG223_14300, partial [Solirubrobacteraceae bacterium]|nr:hypothetical protein [Solirubrobacteraceae bacterium]